jgi:CubicO group peptidase (beta-lactamase class C family)
MTTYFLPASLLSSTCPSPDEEKPELHHYLFPSGKVLQKERTRKRQTLSAIVSVDDCIVYEDAADGFSVDQPLLLWSITKSIVNLAIGVAVDQKILDLEASLSDFYPESRYRFISELRVRHVLEWSSGIFWRENYEFAPLRSDVVAMLYTKGREDMASYVLSRRSASPPRESFNYSTGDSTLLMGILQKTLPEGQSAIDFIQKELFTPLGITTASWESDTAGTLIGGASLFMSARDLLKLGQLVLNQGRWNNRQIIQADWFNESFKIVPAFRQRLQDRISQNGTPGSHWWINKVDEDRNIRKAWPDAPEDSILAQGHWGQRLVIIPSQNLVAVRFGNELWGASRLNDFISQLSEFGQRQKIPSNSMEGKK